MVAYRTMNQTALVNGKSKRSKRTPLKSMVMQISGIIEDDHDYFSQPRALFELMTPEQQQALFDNIARTMGDALDFIKYRHVRNCRACHPAYGDSVAEHSV